MLKERSAQHKVNQEAYAVLFKSIIDHPGTAYELAEVSGLHLLTVQDLMRVFAKHQIVHIVAWEPNGRGIDTTPVWSFGKGRDVARRIKTRAQIASDYRARRRLRLMVNLTPDPPKDVAQ